MKQQLIHRVGKFHWNIIADNELLITKTVVHITIKSNCPEYDYYPVKVFTSETSEQNAAIFLIWVRQQPVNQFANVVKYMLMGYRLGFGWADNYLRGKEYFERASRGEKIEQEEKIKLVVRAFDTVNHRAKGKIQ